MAESALAVLAARGKWRSGVSGRWPMAPAAPSPYRRISTQSLRCPTARSSPSPPRSRTAEALRQPRPAMSWPTRRPISPWVCPPAVSRSSREDSSPTSWSTPTGAALLRSTRCYVCPCPWARPSSRRAAAARSLATRWSGPSAPSRCRRLASRRSRCRSRQPRAKSSTRRPRSSTS